MLTRPPHTRLASTSATLPIDVAQWAGRPDIKPDAQQQQRQQQQSVSEPGLPQADGGAKPHSQKQLPEITLVLGGPGSGKGTQSTRLATELGMAHLSTGELLRQQVAAGTELGAQIEGLISRGRLVPDHIVVGALQSAVKEIVRAGTGARGILLDGFPRTLAQARLFEECVGPPRTVVYFDAPPDVLRARLAARGRADDTEAVIEERLRLHAVETPSVVEFYKQNGMLAGTRAATARSPPRARLVSISAVDGPDKVYGSVREHFTTRHQPQLASEATAPPRIARKKPFALNTQLLHVSNTNRPRSSSAPVFRSSPHLSPSSSQSQRPGTPPPLATSTQHHHHQLPHRVTSPTLTSPTTSRMQTASPKMGPRVVRGMSPLPMLLGVVVQQAATSTGASNFARSLWSPMRKR